MIISVNPDTNARAGESTSESAPPMSTVSEEPGFMLAHGGAIVTAANEQRSPRRTRLTTCPCSSRP
jgi:hypothetical protein